MAYQIDNSTATIALPTPGPIGPNPNGFFTSGNPGLIAATIVDTDWLNSVQGEICNAVTASGLTLNKASQTQLAEAITRSNVHGSMAFLTSGSFTVPANVFALRAAVVGGGGGGGGCLVSQGAAGGGAGGTAMGVLAVEPAQVITVTVGAGGSGGAATPTAGGTGGASTVLTFSAKFPFGGGRLPMLGSLREA